MNQKKQISKRNGLKQDLWKYLWKIELTSLENKHKDPIKAEQ